MEVRAVHARSASRVARLSGKTLRDHDKGVARCLRNVFSDAASRAGAAPSRFAFDFIGKPGHPGNELSPKGTAFPAFPWWTGVVPLSCPFSPRCLRRTLTGLPTDSLFNHILAPFSP